MSIRFEAIAGSIMLFLLLTLLGALNAESADYFPLSVGNRWVYSPSYGDKGDRVDSIIGQETINDTQLISGIDRKLPMTITTRRGGCLTIAPT